MKVERVTDVRYGRLARLRRMPVALTVLSSVEILAVAAVVLSDWLLPSLVVCALAAISLAVRRLGPVSLGLEGAPGWALAFRMLGFALIWSLFQLSVAMPVAHHVSGKQQDLSSFSELQGNVTLLLILIGASWILGAFLEEFAFRGYLLTRLRDVFGSTRLALATAVLVSSLLFGSIHTEQGVVGVLIVSLDGVAFAVVRLRYGTLWASILAHGFNNTLGFLAFFLVGPIYGFW